MRKILIVVYIMFLSLILVSCGYGKGLPEYESTYFRYAVKTNEDKTKVGYLVGLTELGLQQTVLVLPRELDGIPIQGFGYERPIGIVGSIPVGNIESETLQKLYVNFDTSDKDSTNSDYWAGGYSYANLPNCIIFYLPTYSVVHANISGGDAYTYKYYTSIADRTFGDKRWVDKIANISYMYNYDSSPHEGYYWIDSYDKTIVEAIPPNPLREGYVFDGWYKEEECKNRWNFETDITGEELILVESEQYDKYEGISLYAKWLKSDIAR